MNFGLYVYPENPEVTKAYGLVRRGKLDAARRILIEQGYENPDYEIQKIEGFIKFQADYAAAEKNRNNNHVKPNNNARRTGRLLPGGRLEKASRFYPRRHKAK